MFAIMNQPERQGLDGLLRVVEVMKFILQSIHGKSGHLEKTDCQSKGKIMIQLTSSAKMIDSKR